MKRTQTLLSAVLLITACGPSWAAPSSADAAKSEISAMHWADASGVRLDASKSVIVDLPQFQIVRGPEAHRFREIVDGSAPVGLEADAINPTTSSEVIYQWFPAGFVSSDDWNDVDADSFIKQIKEADAAANKVRKDKGIPTLTTTGWRQKPELNRATHTVSWAIDGVDSDGGRVTNFVALKLGRYGFERIAWVIDPSDIGASNDLLVATNNHRFDNGAGYADYVAGKDNVAEYGVAGLVASALGVKLAAKFGLVALLAVFAKKAGIFIFAAFAVVGGWLKRLRSRRSSVAISPVPTKLG